MKIIVTYEGGQGIEYYNQIVRVNAESVQWIYSEFEKHVNRLIKESEEYYPKCDEAWKKIKLFQDNHNVDEENMAINELVEIRKKEPNWTVNIANIDWYLKEFCIFNDNLDKQFFSPPKIQTLDEWFDNK